MGRHRVAWVVCLPLSAIGLVLAHELAWGFSPHVHEGEAGHGYFGYAALVAVLAAATALVAALVHLTRAVATGSSPTPYSPRAFAVLPLVAFLLQEHVEHVLRAQELEIAFFVSTPFVVGLALQLPFALLAYVASRFVLGVVRHLARAVRAQRAPAARASLRLLVPLSATLAPRPAVATHGARRGPPSPRLR
jgi:hypothetical protein